MKQWRLFSFSYEGSTTIRRRIPNTLNTWSITGFSLDPLFGLGLISSPRKLKVSKPFVVTLDLPHSIQRGETIAIPVVVYNHMKLDTVAEITLHNPEQKFVFTDVKMQRNATKSKLTDICGKCWNKIRRIKQNSF